VLGCGFLRVFFGVWGGGAPPTTAGQEPGATKAVAYLEVEDDSGCVAESIRANTEAVD
jgi:hypothetical protein